MKLISKHKCFNGILSYYSHSSSVTHCDMRFSLFLPPAAEHSKVPVLTYLSGLTCTEENFTVKAGAYRSASALGLAIIAPDTSPRGDDVPDQEGIELGKGAGFYIDAIQAPWNTNYQMYSYITQELYQLTGREFPINNEQHGIFGHSMGGHGALVIYLRNQDKYKSVSAFAPICSAIHSPWGHNALQQYLGDDPSLWTNYDAVELMTSLGDASTRPEILVDQGLADSAYLEGRLNPHLLKEACMKVEQKLKLREHEGYDHGYFFIQSFIDDHLQHHKALLG